MYHISIPGSGIETPALHVPFASPSQVIHANLPTGFLYLEIYNPVCFWEVGLGAQYMILGAA